MPRKDDAAGAQPAATGQTQTITAAGQQLMSEPMSREILPEMQRNGNHFYEEQQAAMGGNDGLDDELDALYDEAKVEPSDKVTEKRISDLIDLFGGYTGDARTAALDALRPLIGRLTAEERQRLNLFPLFDAPKQKEQIEAYLATCPLPDGAPVFASKGLADLLAMPPKEWLIDQVLGAGDLGMIYGPPGSGKTFAVIDLVFAACLGEQWAGRFDVARPLTVAYCAGEGVSGLPQRFAAAAELHGVGDLPGFRFFDIAPQLYDASAPETMARFVSDWQNSHAGPLDLLVIDTLHSATSGAEENSAKDMGEVLAAIKQAARALGCAVLLVHHSNKAGTGERGSSTLRGAMDIMIEVKPVAGKFALSLEKLKDGATWKPQTFDLIAKCESVAVWWDEPGDMPNATGKQAERALAVLQENPTEQFTAKQVAEAIGATQNATNNVLARLTEKGQVTRTLQDGAKGASNRNPWLYQIADQGAGS